MVDQPGMNTNWLSHRKLLLSKNSRSLLVNILLNIGPHDVGKRYGHVKCGVDARFTGFGNHDYHYLSPSLEL